jgi:hypothetical protein
MSNSILEDPTQYIVEFSEQTKYACLFIGIALFLIVIFFVTPISISSFSSYVVKFIIVVLLGFSSFILFKAVAPVVDIKGALETDEYPDLKKNFFITMFFIFVLFSLGVIVIRR